jgi:hypothetical protein
MGLKKLYTTQPFRFRILLLTGLLLLIGVDVIQRSITKYNIPVVGWIFAVGEYRHANASYWQAIDEGVQPWREFYATQIAFAHTHTASISTLAFLALCSILISWFCRRTVDLNSISRTSLGERR